MKRISRRGSIVLAMFAALVSMTPTAKVQAQSYPDRAITLVVGFAPGSPTDLVARQLAKDLSSELEQSVVVLNRPGGSGTIAGSYVARARPDGYTLYLANLPSVVSPSLQAGLPYHGIRDFAPIATVLSVTLVMYASQSVPAKNLSEFVALLRANPAKYTYGSSGVASPIHLVAEMFEQQTGTKAVHVPYKGGGEVVQALLSDQVSFGFVTMNTMQFVREGKLKAFGVASLEPDPAVPDLPTMDEEGVKGFDKGVEYVLVAPKEIASDIAEHLNQAVNRVITSESFVEKIRQIGGMRISPTRTRDQSRMFITDQEETWDRIVDTGNIKLE